MLKNENTIFNIVSEKDFLKHSLDIFKFQYNYNAIYKQWVDLLNVKPADVSQLKEIPFLPIEFFKKHQVVSSPITENTIKFTSSATTSQQPSTHYVNDVTVYEQSFNKAFDMFYGNPEQYCILALLPNYLQRGGSSLVYMCKQLIERSAHPLSGFFLDTLHTLPQKIEELKKNRSKGAPNRGVLRFDGFV